MSRVTVVALSEAFGKLWHDLAVDLDIAIEIVAPGKPYPPSSETAAASELPRGSTPLEVKLTRVVVPATRSRTNTSLASFVSPGTRLLA